LRIAIIAKTYEEPFVEGIRKLARKLVGYLESCGDEVWIITPSPAVGKRVVSQAKYYGRRMEKLFFLKFAAKELDEIKPDAIFIFTNYSSTLGLKTYFLKRFGGAPVVVYVSSVGSITTFSKLLYSAKRTIVYSEYLKKFLPSGEVAVPFIDTTELRPEKKDWSGARNVLFIGAFQKDRGVEVLIRAMSELRNKVDARLLIAFNNMDSGADRIEEEIERWGIGDITERLGRVDISDAYNRAHVVAIPRLTDRFMTFPLRFLECFHMRTPMVVSDVCGFRESIRGAGLVVPHGDSGALACALERLLTNGELYSECVLKCGEAAEFYNSEKSLARIREIISGAVGKQ
jgi:glycosyltransferase involved in cell wall biosynthesis